MSYAESKRGRQARLFDNGTDDPQEAADKGQALHGRRGKVVSLRMTDGDREKLEALHKADLEWSGISPRAFGPWLIWRALREVTHAKKPKVKRRPPRRARRVIPRGRKATKAKKKTRVPRTGAEWLRAQKARKARGATRAKPRAVKRKRSSKGRGRK